MLKLMASTLMVLVIFCNTKSAETDKTLVSWVKLNDLSIRGGSILTLQKGQQFDGIVFGELEHGVWIAGSDDWNRTQKNLKNSPREEHDQLGEFIQMGISYGT